MLKEHVNELGISSRVSFLGFRQDVADCLMASDIFAMPSLTEGLPISLLEALAAGLPVVASAVGGIPAALGTPAAGILTQPCDVGALTEALKRLSQDHAARTDLGAMARQRATAYTLERMTDRYESIYYKSTGHA
jgi:glycosyltransferase involved in cell wall biosynthesis